MSIEPDFPIPMQELRNASTEALLRPLRERLDAIQEELLANLIQETGLSRERAVEVFDELCGCPDAADAIMARLKAC